MSGLDTGNRSRRGERVREADVEAANEFELLPRGERNAEGLENSSAGST